MASQIFRCIQDEFVSVARNLKIISDLNLFNIFQEIYVYISWKMLNTFKSDIIFKFLATDTNSHQIWASQLCNDMVG